MIEWSKQIPGAIDAELGIPRKAPITYHCAARDKSAAGLMFVIHGFGDDASDAYSKLLRRYIAETANLLVVTVEYHCYQARPSSGAMRHLPPETYERMAFWATKYGIPFPAVGENIMPFLEELGRKAEHTIILTGELRPPNGDYQNFGVLQALDHLAVLNDLIDGGFGFDANRIFLMGSSHGGYVAHLVARLAPNSMLGVIDNSSYTDAETRFLGVLPEYTEVIGNVHLGFSLATKWQFAGTHLPNYYSPSRAVIRDTGCFGHLAAAAAAAAAKRKCQFVMFNTVDDMISPIDRKRRQFSNLKRAGFSASLKEVTADEAGGALFNSMEHADAPLQKLFAHAFGQFSEGTTTLDRYLGTEIRFDCFDRVYIAVHRNTPPYFELRIEPNPNQ